jgi:hypothetical protein
MAIVEARLQDGRVYEIVEVNLTKSGLFLMITDTSGNQVFVHRYAWDGLVQAVQELFEQEKQRAQEHIQNYPQEED